MSVSAILVEQQLVGVLPDYTHSILWHCWQLLNIQIILAEVQNCIITIIHYELILQQIMMLGCTKSILNWQWYRSKWWNSTITFSLNYFYKLVNYIYIAYTNWSYLLLVQYKLDKEYNYIIFILLLGVSIYCCPLLAYYV